MRKEARPWRRQHKTGIKLHSWLCSEQPRPWDVAALTSRAGEASLHARISERMPPGVVWVTFRHAVTRTDVVITGRSEWATNRPEYEVAAVRVRPRKRGN